VTAADRRERLSGLVALVTGGGRGLGRAIALEMSREGARVVVNDIGTAATGGGRDPERARGVADEIVAAGGEAVSDSGDVAEWADAGAMVGTAIDRFGKLDIVVNAAGIIRLGTPLDTTQEDFDAIMRVNLRGLFNVTHFAAKHFVARNEYGRLINFASGASIVSQPSILAYATTKTGIVGFTRSCANALAAYHVTANSIRPSAHTGMSDALYPSHIAHFAETGRRSSELAVGTDMDPAHVTPLAVFLASPAAGHISGRLFEGRAGRYILWKEPEEERVLEGNFLSEPDEVYAGLEEALGAGLSLRDLKMPMAPILTDEGWKSTYGTQVPTWDFGGIDGV
jgi:3-oxoacyl-[acyl-carrier protein] reductase